MDKQNSGLWSAGRFKGHPPRLSYVPTYNEIWLWGDFRILLLVVTALNDATLILSYLYDVLPSEILGNMVLLPASLEEVYHRYPFLENKRILTEAF